MNFVHPDDVAKTIEAASRVSNGQPVTNFINRYRRNDGNYLYISWCSILSTENEMVYGIARDVTENILKEERIRLNERKLAQNEFFLSEVGKIARFGGWEYDVVTKAVKWSKAVYDIYQLPFDYDPNNEDLLRFYREPFRGKVEAALSLAISDGVSWDIELELTTMYSPNKYL